jgi:Retrotransposon gag protein/Zinc knuckle
MSRRGSPVNSGVWGGSGSGAEEDERALRAAAREARRAQLLAQQEAAARALAALDEAGDGADVNVGAGGAGGDRKDPEGDDSPRGVATTGSNWKPPVVRSPEPFSGVPGAGQMTAVEWCDHVQSLALYAFPPSANHPEEGQIAWAAMFLEKLAAAWWREPGVRAANKTWARFERSLRARFQPEDLERAARARLGSLFQGAAGLQAYVAAVQRELAFLPDMNEKDKVAAFNRGLSPALLEGVLRREPRPKDLQAAVAQAVLEESLLAELASVRAQRDATGGRSRNVGGASLAAAEAQEPAEVTAQLAQLRAQLATTTAQLAALQAGSSLPDRGGGRSGRGRGAGRGGARISEEERQRRFAGGLCFRCAKAGHRAAECPDKAKPMATSVPGGAGAGAGAADTAKQGKD